jgi:long-chain fatty acid transport protein
VQDAYRTARLPDGDRTWLALGAKYTANPRLWFDIGAAYIWVNGGSIDDMGSPPNVAQNGLINGSYDNRVVVLSGQLTWAF